MINGQTVLAVIPARAGSKRVPEKNFLPYRGKPLIQWAVESAHQSRYIDDLVISSDSDRVAGLDAAFLLRPHWLSTDSAMNEGVLIHTLYTYRWTDWVVLLQPTSPLRTSADIDTAIERAQLGRGCVSFNEYGKRNGAVYVTRSTELVAHATFNPETFDQFLIMPNERSLDIDYATDFDA
jgi:CMP-N-acetylneuraminic acid synthetase